MKRTIITLIFSPSERHGPSAERVAVNQLCSIQRLQIFSVVEGPQHAVLDLDYVEEAGIIDAICKAAAGSREVEEKSVFSY